MRIREMDWSATDLGLPEVWPADLRAALEVLLGIAFPAFLWWGPRFLAFRNDAAAPLAPEAAPASKPGGPLWTLLAAAVETTARTGETRIARIALPAPEQGAERLFDVSLSSPWRGNETGAAGVIALIQPRETPREAESPDPAAEIQALKRQIAEIRRSGRNTLAVIRSIVRRTGAPGQSDGQSVPDYVDHLDGRIAALARVQTALARNPRAGVNLALLAADTLVAAGARETREFTLAGPEVLLRGKTAETLGLALHELTTNAVKFGALSRRGGRIAVDWRIETGERSRPLLALDWTERGVPAAPPALSRPAGFGSELLDRTMAYEIDAEVVRRLEPGGLTCRIRLPFPGQDEA